jgi:hypothetical protein
MITAEHMRARSAAGALVLSIFVRATVIVGVAWLAALPVTAAAAPDILIRGEGRGTSEDPYIVPRTDCLISVDAFLDEDAWDEALVLAVNVEVEPGENVEAPVKTEVLLTCDADNLYAAFRCYDPDPDAVTAHIADRDHVPSSNDWVALILDTFNDERRSFDVLVNAAGVQEDFIETATGGGSWDAIWDSAGRITEWGYAVELAVPFKQLRFQRSNGPQIWGLDVVRSYPREHRYHIGAFPRDRGNNCYLCQAVKISGFEGVSPGKNIEIVPTLTGVQTAVREGFPDGPLSTENEDLEFGVTGKWGVTPNLTVSGTVNPDFAEVEADAVQLDINSPFALSFDERRPFFLEGVTFFNTLKRAFYSRAVRDPLWGVKLTGKDGDHTIGVGVMRDEITNVIIPGSEYSSGRTLDHETTDAVFRYKLDVGSNYTLGALATDRRNGEYSNTVMGADADLKFTRSDQVQLQALWSTTEYPEEIVADFDQPEGRFGDTFLAFEYDHDGRDAYWWADYDVCGPDFRADLGFIPRVGFRNIEGGAMYTWFADPPRWWTNVTSSYDAWYYEDWDHHLLQAGQTFSVNGDGALQSWSYAGVNFFREGYLGDEYDLTSYNVSAGFRPNRSVYLEMDTAFGDRIDYANGGKGDRLQAGAEVSLHIGKHLEGAFEHTYERFDVPGGRLYTANISELKAVYQFNVRTFLRAILQYEDYELDPALYTEDVPSEERGLYSQLLFSYKLNPQTVVFLGYSGSLLGDQDIELTEHDRTFFVKLGYAWLL